ncbi:MAG: hypothetical protein WC822_06525 [Candidatus Paceibacterota bacterium]|jgi:hypothetical protein
MTNIIGISKMPTIAYGEKAFHESVFRSYNILEEVKELLHREVPGDIILELIKEMESGQLTDETIKDLDEGPK